MKKVFFITIMIVFALSATINAQVAQAKLEVNGNTGTTEINPPTTMDSSKKIVRTTHRVSAIKTGYYGTERVSLKVTTHTQYNQEVVEIVSYYDGFSWVDLQYPRTVNKVTSSDKMYGKFDYKSTGADTIYFNF